MIVVKYFRRGIYKHVQCDKDLQKLSNTAIMETTMTTTAPTVGPQLPVMMSTESIRMSRTVFSNYMYLLNTEDVGV